MDELAVWTAPLVLLPGKALLTISTANRYSQLLLFLEARDAREPHFRRRLAWLSAALIALYAGVAIDAVATLINGLLSYVRVPSMLPLFMSCAGVGALLAASACLTAELFVQARKPA